ncbi:MAG: urease accessory protein UreF, partial [Burkholderiales bacterium]|nr:urease accessory protein UreF [Burkholderiales bacterium]
MITITAPITATTITTTIDPSQLLRLMWLASPALPVGGFSYSEGLEAAVEAGRVRGEAQAGDWLLAQMELTLARAEGPVLARACAAWQAHDAARIVELNDWLRRTRETAELRA